VFLCNCRLRALTRFEIAATSFFATTPVFATLWSVRFKNDAADFLAIPYSSDYGKLRNAMAPFGDYDSPPYSEVTSFSGTSFVETPASAVAAPTPWWICADLPPLGPLECVTFLCWIGFLLRFIFFRLADFFLPDFFLAGFFLRMPESITGVFLGQSRRSGGLCHAGTVAPFPHHSSVVFTTFKAAFALSLCGGFHGLPGALRALVGELDLCSFKQLGS
jgi:hypothetical protein